LTSEPAKLVEHFFRHEFGRLVSILTKRLGTRHIDLAEDVAQSALSLALKHWAHNGIPNNPGGWLFRVANRLAIDAIRRESMASRRLSELHNESRNSHEPNAIDSHLDEEEITDDQLRLLLACCQPSLSHESSIALALKVLGGFSVSEIAHALLTSQANVQKRITRAKEKLRESPSLLDQSESTQVKDRIEAVSLVIYLLFNEGYLSSHAEVSIRRDLCEEAKRLARLVVSHPEGESTEVYALLALMSFHIARLDARTDSTGEVLLLDRQDRTQWNWHDIREGMDWMNKSAAGVELSRFHIEAAIAWEHCRAERFEETDWPKIRGYYDVLLHRVSSPIQLLNRAIAEYYCSGPRPALDIIDELPAILHPKGYPIWHAVLGFLHKKNGNDNAAMQHWVAALSCTHSRAEQELLRRRIESCKC
jgi:RNA polymerase sigma factor (sigma-70 family)